MKALSGLVLASALMATSLSATAAPDSSSHRDSLLSNLTNQIGNQIAQLSIDTLSEQQQAAKKTLEEWQASISASFATSAAENGAENPSKQTTDE